MNIIIAGDGEVGLHLAEALEHSDHNITIVDPHEELLKMMESHSDLMTIAGDSTSIKTLQKANVKRADMVIAVLHDEHINLLTGILAKKLGAKRVIARVNTMENIGQEAWRIYQDLGIDGIVSPEDIAAQEIVSLLKQTGATEAYDFAGGKLEMYMMKLDDKAYVIGKTLNEIAERFKHLDFRPVAIHRRQNTFIPHGTDTLQAGDMVYVISKPHAVKELMAMGGKQKFNIRNVMIIGGGRVGRMTAKRLEKDMDIKIIESNKNRCYELTSSLSNTLVVNADARNVDMLEEEGIKSVDAFIAVTENTETNILTCLQAKAYGVKRTIALVENIDYIDISQNIGIDTIINKKLIAASYIVRYTLGDNVSTLKFLSGIDADIVEFVVPDGCLATLRPIEKLHVPEGAIIAGVIRGELSYIATEEFQIEAEDRVVVFAMPNAIKDVEKLFR